MSSNEDIFQISGPVHLSSINWSSPDDQRVVLAALVQATYILEKDRTNRHVGPQALAPPWWQHFHFECKKTLEDNSDKSIFGCIYEFKPPLSPDPSAPKFVVAFRGTMPDRNHGFRDLRFDATVMVGGINNSTRVKTAIDTIYNIIDNFETENIWLAGHSLGASIATVTGKHMAKTSINLKTFLFNPPFPSINLDWFPNLGNKFKDRLRTYKTVFKGGVILFSKNHRMQSHEEFSKLATWTPYLFVNPDDPISTAYLRYFEERKKKRGWIRGHLEQIATRTSLREICSNVRDRKMPHLLPSACLAVNRKKMNNFLQSHALHQWWQHDICLELSDHHYQLQEDIVDPKA